MQLTPDSNGFPQGYFMLRSVASDRVLDTKMDWCEDDTSILLFPSNEKSLVECETSLCHILPDIINS
jgi:hypothetical protein